MRIETAPKLLTTRAAELVRVPFYIPDIGHAELEAIRKVLESGWLSTGQVTHEFERRFASFQQCRFAIAVNSCTSGLFLCLKTLGIGLGDEVITTPFTFLSTVHAILEAGARPVFVDVELDTGNMDADAIPGRISRRTRAIMPVHLYGRPCRMDRIMELARMHDLRVVNDAAHALEARFQERALGCLGDFTVFSFYPSKNLTTGEGGMVTTSDPELAARVRKLSYLGLDENPWEYHRKSGLGHDTHTVSLKYNMTDIAGALGLAQLASIQKRLARRTSIWAMYTSRLRELEAVKLPPEDNHVHHARHLYTLVLAENSRFSRDLLRSHLHKRGVETAVHYRPYHLTSFYLKQFGREHYPNAEALWRTITSLPLHSRLTDEQVQYVVDSVQEYLTNLPASRSVVECAIVRR